MGRDPWFGRPFDKLTVLSKVEGLTTLSEVDPSTKLRVDAEQRRSIEGESSGRKENRIILDLPPSLIGVTKGDTNSKSGIAFLE